MVSRRSTSTLTGDASGRTYGSPGARRLRDQVQPIVMRFFAMKTLLSFQGILLTGLLVTHLLGLPIWFLLAQGNSQSH